MYHTCAGSRAEEKAAAQEEEEARMKALGVCKMNTRRYCVHAVM